MSYTAKTLSVACALSAGLMTAALPASAQDRPPDVHRCYTLAGSDHDKGLPAPYTGVPFDQIDTARAIPACRAAVAANPGHARLLYQLGRALDVSEASAAEAAEYYQQSADLGFGLALNNLGALYSDGRGVPVDAARAVTLYRSAAEAGVVMAQSNLASHYWDGTGVTQDYAKAIALYRKAAEAGDALAMYWLGQAHETGKGTSVDLTEALKWYSASAKAGDLDSALEAARLYAMEDDTRSADYDAAAIFYRQAVKSGHVRAAGYLAEDIQAGKVAPVDDRELLDLLALAASDGDVSRMLRLWQALNDAGDHDEALQIAYAAYDRAVAAPLSDENGWPPFHLTAARSVQRTLAASNLSPRTAEELEMFQRDFAITDIRKFVLPIQCRDHAQDFDLYVWDWSRDTSMVAAQFDWMEQARGCTVVDSIRTAFADVWDLAKASGGSYADLTGQEIDDTGQRYPKD